MFSSKRKVTKNVAAKTLLFNAGEDSKNFYSRLVELFNSYGFNSERLVSIENDLYFHWMVVTLGSNLVSMENKNSDIFREMEKELIYEALYYFKDNYYGRELSKRMLVIRDWVKKEKNPLNVPLQYIFENLPEVYSGNESEDVIIDNLIAAEFANYSRIWSNISENIKIK